MFVLDGWLRGINFVEYLGVLLDCDAFSRLQGGSHWVSAVSFALPV